jgi:hypothetical protein
LRNKSTRKVQWFGAAHGQSLTAPLIAKRPMSPPGKKIGVTVKESVVNAGCVREERNCSRESPYRLLSGRGQCTTHDDLRYEFDYE